MILSTHILSNIFLSPTIVRSSSFVILSVDGNFSVHRQHNISKAFSYPLFLRQKSLSHKYINILQTKFFLKCFFVSGEILVDVNKLLILKNASLACTVLRTIHAGRTSAIPSYRTSQASESIGVCDIFSPPSDTSLSLSYTS